MTSLVHLACARLGDIFVFRIVGKALKGRRALELMQNRLVMYALESIDNKPIYINERLEDPTYLGTPLIPFRTKISMENQVLFLVAIL